MKPRVHCITHPYICLLCHWGVAVEVYHFWSSVHGSGIPLDLREGATKSLEANLPSTYFQAHTYTSHLPLLPPSPSLIFLDPPFIPQFFLFLSSLSPFFHLNPSLSPWSIHPSLHPLFPPSINLVHPSVHPYIQPTILQAIFLSSLHFWLLIHIL